MGNKTDKNKFFVYWIALDEEGNPDLKVEACIDQMLAQKKCDEKESIVKGVRENIEKEEAKRFKTRFKDKYIKEYNAKKSEMEMAAELSKDEPKNKVVDTVSTNESENILETKDEQIAGSGIVAETSNDPLGETFNIVEVWIGEKSREKNPTYSGKVCEKKYPITPELEQLESEGQIIINRSHLPRELFMNECAGKHIETGKYARKYLGLEEKTTVSETKKAQIQPTKSPESMQATNNASKPPFGIPQPRSSSVPQTRDYSRDFDRLNNKISDMVSKCDSLSNRLTDLKRNVDSIPPQIARILNETKQDYNANNRDSRDFINQKISKVSDSVLEVSDKLDPFKRNIDETKSAVESIEGELKEVKDQLTLKGMTLTKDIRPENADQKVIANAKRLIDRLVGDITDAALEYALHRDIIEGAAQQEEARNIEETEKISKAREDGRQEMLVEILEKVSDIDAFLDDENNAIIRGILNNHGLKKDKKLAKGNKIKVNADEVQKYLAKVSGIKDAGEYLVEKSMYMIGKKTFTAVVAKVEAPKPETGLSVETVEETENKGEDKGDK